MTPSATPAGVPAFMLGMFEDDYGDHHVVSREQWMQAPQNRYRIVRWVPAQQYLIAQNDRSNAAAPNRWTRIDWVPLVGMAPYEWAFCFSAFDARSAAAAESVTVARHDTPRTGCNTFPFSRMKRAQYGAGSQPPRAPQARAPT